MALWESCINVNCKASESHNYKQILWCGEDGFEGRRVH